MATSTKTSSMDRSHRARPIHEIRMGQVRAAIWENETEKGTRYNVTVSRIYKVDDQWRDSNSFHRDDLPLVSKVVDMCHTWIFAEAADRRESNR